MSKDKIPENYVRMGQLVCFVCGEKFHSGEVLIHKRLQEIPEEHTVTGYGLCPKEQGYIADGRVIMIGCDPEHTPVTRDDDGGERVQGGEAHRTGGVVYIKREMFLDIFEGADIPDPPIVFAEQALLDKLRQLAWREGEQEQGHELSPAWCEMCSAEATRVVDEVSLCDSCELPQEDE